MKKAPKGSGSKAKAKGRPPLALATKKGSAPFARIDDAVEAVRAGKMIIIVDDADRENEGDLMIAAEKVTAHLTLLTIVAVVLGLAAWLAGARFAKLPGDEISLQAAVGFALWIELMALAFGGFAFVLAQFLGRRHRGDRRCAVDYELKTGRLLNLLDGDALVERHHAHPFRGWFEIENAERAQY